MQLVVACDCSEFVDALREGKVMSHEDFMERKRWANRVSICGHKSGNMLFARAETRTGTHQVAIEKGDGALWLCKHGLAALSLLGKRKVQVLWDNEQAEMVANSVVKTGMKVRVFEVNGCVTAICW
jgi:hypothetical protein